MGNDYHLGLATLNQLGDVVDAILDHHRLLLVSLLAGSAGLSLGLESAVCVCVRVCVCVCGGRLCCNSCLCPVCIMALNFRGAMR